MSEEIEYEPSEIGDEGNEVKGAYVPGTLYIMNETDYLDGTVYEYYKIGIVRGEKDVTAREKEHRTGNPRRIASVCDIVSPAVQKLETRLHNEFARHRTSSGEWFYLPGDLVQQVISRAHALNAELETDIDALNLGKTISGPGAAAAIEPDSTMQVDADALAELEAKLAVVVANQKAIAKSLSELAEGKPEWAHLFEPRNVAATNKFSVAELKKRFKSLYESYQTIPKVTVNPRWVVSTPEVDPAQTLTTLGLTLAETLGDDPRTLHQEYLAHWASKAEIEWGLELAQARLLAASRDAVGITGVLEWSIRESMNFDTAAFKADHEDVYSQCFKTTEAKTTYRVAEWASYSL